MNFDENDLKIIQQIEKELHVTLKKLEEIEWNSQGYTLNDNGEIVGLSLNDCKIGNLSRIISPLKDLKQLTELRVWGNRINDLSLLKELSQLTVLWVGNNQLKDITPLKSLNSLTQLYLGGNQISDISPLESLVKLEQLWLNHNQISNISPLKNLINLRTLWLYKNRISDLTPLKGLGKLQLLYLKNNPLEELPVWITDFNMDIYWTKAYPDKGIVFYDNPLKNPPVDIVNQGKEAIRTHFKTPTEIPTKSSGKVTMAKTRKNTNPYANVNLRQQLYMEARAMAEYALSKGKSVPAIAIKNVEEFEDRTPLKEGEIGDGFPRVRMDLDITALVSTHDVLSHLIEPATPQTVLLLDVEQESNSLFSFLGPVALVRQLMFAAIFFLIIFVVLLASPYIDSEKLSQEVLDAHGIEQFFRLIFYISSAGLGASFASLYKANSYISKGTYDPSYQAAYWVSFSLGIISGLLLALLISESSVQSEGMLSKGVTRPLLALLGGFSADLLYTFLNRMVETFKSLFEGGTQNIIESKAQEGKSRIAAQAIENRMKLAQDLMKLQQQVGSTSNPEEIQNQINQLLQGLTQVRELRDVSSE
jgi:hypothetical protein